MPLTRPELLAPLLARFATLKAIAEPTPDERIMLRQLRGRINAIRGVEGKDQDDAEAELEDAYEGARAAAALASATWPDATISEWRAAMVALEQLRLGQDVAARLRVRKLLRDIADGTTLAPESVVEQAHEWLEQWYDIVVDGRPSELAYQAAAAAATTPAEWEAVQRMALTIGQRIEARRARREATQA
jgi:hypothetical protein